MRAYPPIFSIALLAWLSVAVFVGFRVRDTNAASEYPIAELGYCSSRDACASYCEQPEHKAACWSYATYVDATPDAGGVVAGDTTQANSSNNALQHVSFPIEELGDCENVRACRAYCNVTEHFEACTTFGEEHGLLPPSQQTLLRHAEQELGCSSTRDCRVYCDDPAHVDRCVSFAESYVPQTLSMRMRSLLKDAHDALGCSDISSCKALCSQADMRLRCHQFAMHHRGKNKQDQALEDTLPCDGYQECREYCSLPEHATRCSVSSDRDGDVRINVRNTPGYTCETEAECATWCRANPGRCPGYMESDEYQSYEAERMRRADESDVPTTTDTPQEDDSDADKDTYTIDLPSGTYRPRRAIHPPGELEDDLERIEVEWEDAETDDDTDDFGDDH